MEIQRYNLFDLIGSRDNIFHSAILTSYTFDPIFFESFFLPKLRHTGVNNIIVLLDSSSYDEIILQYPSYGFNSDKRLYNLVRKSPSKKGVFHPKVSMIFGEGTGMLVVGSGNLTYNGNGLNDEIWNVFSLKGSDSKYLPLFVNSWDYLNAMQMPDSILLKQQIKWIKENTNWLPVNSEPLFKDITLDNVTYQLLTNSSDQTIMSSLKEIVGNERVEVISMISPFYDMSGALINDFYEAFRPQIIQCGYSDSGIYPYELMKEKPKWLEFFDWRKLEISKQRRFHNLHAKIIQITLPTRTILISGSANMTKAAFYGANDEVCVAVVSYQNKNFIKNLGIKLNESTFCDSKDLKKILKPNPNEKPAIKKEIQITSAEVIDEKLYVTIKSHSSCKTLKSSLRIFDLNGREINKFDIEELTNKVNFYYNDSRGYFVVIANEEGKEISNRCLILKEDDVTHFNPNKTLRKLESLLDNHKEWKNNLENILSYLWIDDQSDKIDGLKQTSKKNQKKESSDHIVSENEFDNIHLGARNTILSLPDVKIIDFLLNTDKNHKEFDLEDTSDDIDSVENIESGNNEYNSPQSVNKIEVNNDFFKPIENYSKKLRKHYDARLEPIYKTASNFGLDLFKIPADYVNVKDFSRILIDIVLIWKEISKDFNFLNESLRSYFISNLGKFLILSRGAYPKTEDYAWHKCVEFNNNLIIFSLLIISSQKWKTSEKRSVKLLIANLLYNCRELEFFNLTKIKDRFLHEIKEFKVPTDPESLSLIEATMEEYQNFCRHIAPNDFSLVKEIDPNNPEKNYCCRLGFGFFHASNLRKIQQSNENKPIYEISYFHPGFDKIITVLGGRKIRALN